MSITREPIIDITVKMADPNCWTVDPTVSIPKLEAEPVPLALNNPLSLSKLYAGQTLVYKTIAEHLINLITNAVLYFSGIFHLDL